MITRFNSGGTATWLNQLVIGREFIDNEIHLIFGNCSSSEKEAIPSSNFKVTRIRGLRRSINPLYDLVALLNLMLVIRKIKPDIVNTHTFKAGLLGRLACRIASRKSVVIHTVHGHLKYGYFSSFFSRSIMVLEGELERITDGFIVAGNQLLRELKESGLLENSLYKVILPGLEPNSLKEISDKQLGNKIGWVGRLTQIKRPDRALEVARLLPELEFYIAGSGELENQLRSDQPRNVHLEGWVNPEDFWQKMSAGLLTSDNEATPYAIIEGNMAGVPFVATNVGSVADVVEDGENGYLAETDSADLARKLDKLLADKSELHRFGVNARNSSFKKFSRERFQREHSDFYIEVMKERHFH